MHENPPRTPGTAEQEVGRNADNKPYAKDSNEPPYARFIQVQLRCWYASVAVVVVALLLRGLGELFLPACVRLGGVDIWEDEVEDFGVP